MVGPSPSAMITPDIGSFRASIARDAAALAALAPALRAPAVADRQGGGEHLGRGPRDPHGRAGAQQLGEPAPRGPYATAARRR
jgi:hypothetical protein